ncbi:tetratricopeptide repeat protein [bacterium]|nr:tetratricopeptide repeat protein [bacterium]
MAIEDKKAAALSYEKALSLEPQNQQLRLSYVQILNDIGQTAEIEKVLRTAPKQDETMFRARMAFASAANDADALKRLQTELRRAKAIAPETKTFMSAQLYELREKPVEALKSYESIPQSASVWADAQLRRAVLLAGRDAQKPS